MIARQRRLHRLCTLALAVAVPPAFAIALASRSDLPPPAPIPPALAESATSGAALWTHDDLWHGVPGRTRLLAAPQRGAGLLVEVAPSRDPMLPDLLVYWAAEGSEDRLPDGAQLIGRLAGAAPRRFALPLASRAHVGRLYLYSLGHAELVDSAVLPPAAE